MGEYAEVQLAKRYCEQNKDEFTLQTKEIKRILGIPFIWVKESKYEKVYSLFNIILLCEEIKTMEMDI